MTHLANVLISSFNLSVLNEQLVNELGGAGVVAEMTGRKGRMVKKPDGEVVYEKRNANGISMTMQVGGFGGWVGWGRVTHDHACGSLATQRQCLE